MQMVLQALALLAEMVLAVVALRRSSTRTAMSAASRAGWVMVVGVFCAALGWFVAATLLQSWGLGAALLTLDWRNEPGAGIAMLSICATIGLILAIAVATIAEEHAHYLGFVDASADEQSE